jgi:hypothetical protein
VLILVESVDDAEKSGIARPLLLCPRDEGGRATVSSRCECHWVGRRTSFLKKTVNEKNKMGTTNAQTKRIIATRVINF